jgi:glycosyltransferase involved in cell wall biosynthesis
VKVLHVIPSVSAKHGGPSSAIKAIADASERAGIEVVIATTDDDGDDARLEVALEVPVERNGVTYFFFRRDLLSYKVSFGLARWLRRHIAEFDVVHIHALFSFSSTAAARMARRKGVPYVIRPLGVLNRWGLENRRRIVKRLSLRWMERRILRDAAAIHFTAEPEQREAAEAVGNVVAGKSFVIPIPLEVKEEGNKTNFLQKFPAAAGKEVILFLSRLDQKKGLELLLRAFAWVKRDEPNAFLVVAGDGDGRYVESLRAEADRLGIATDMVWTGFLGPREKANAYAAASLFVLPSYSENFGIAAAEAMAAGVALVVSDRVALSESVKKAEAGTVVSCETEDLAKAIQQLLRSSALRNRYAANARMLVESQFASQAVGNALLSLYKNIKPTALSGG